VKQFFLGVFIGCLVFPVAGFLYLRFGYVPVAVDGPVIPFEELLAGTAVQARIARDAPSKAAFPATEENIVAGARLYREHCVDCHGLPGSKPTPVSRGMFPQPPQFFDGQDYWIVSNGIRLSGMPGYKTTLSDEQIWQVSQFVANRDTLSPEADKALRDR